MKKTDLKNKALKGIEMLILVYGNNYRSIELKGSQKVSELSKAEAIELIKRKGTLLLNFGDLEKTSRLNMADGYSVPLNSEEEATVKRFFETEARSLDEMLGVWLSKERDCKILKREVI